MHEYSVVRSLLRQVQEIARSNGGGAIETIRLAVGEFSGVECTLVELAFRDLAPGKIGRQAKLEIHEIPLEAKCENCQQNIIITDYQFCCPLCNSQQVRITSGDELTIIDIELREVGVKA